MRKYIASFILLFFVAVLSTVNVSAASYSTAGSHQKSLQFLESKGITNLESFGRSVTRAEFAMYIVRVLELPSMTSSRTYKDVAANHPYYEEIQTATAAGIIQGDTTTGKFNPSQPISRIHMVRMLTNGLGLLAIKPAKVTKPTFKDTKNVSADYANRIATTYSLGIITGDKATNSFMPFKEATVAQSATFITRFYDVINKQNKWYSVANVVSGSYQLDGYYTSFEAAKKALTKGQVLLYKNNVQHMTSGIAYFKQYSNMTIEKGFKDNDVMAFLSSSELTYVSSTKNNVTLQMGDLQQTYKQQDVVLVPDGVNAKRSYYTVDGGKLVHYIYKHVLQRYEEPYIVGEAPSFTKTGERYYSTDSIHFTNDKGQAVGTYYNYYQFMPFRIHTAYRADELNRIIAATLASVEKKGGRYKGAATKSKLIGLGEVLKQAEKTSQMNAMLLLAIAMHESDYGMSDAAQKQNNLIGAQAVLSMYSQEKYRTPAQSIEKMAAYFSEEYVTPYRDKVDKKRKSAYGGVVGSKAVGMTKKYSADPFWGAKVASIYRALDVQHGQKDAKQAVKLAFVKPVKSGTVALFETAGAKHVAYEYSRFGFPVAINGISGAYTKVKADDPRSDEVFILTTMLQHVETAY